jgi:hypothetical protein
VTKEDSMNTAAERTMRVLAAGIVAAALGSMGLVGALALLFSSYLIDIAPSFPTKEVRIKPGTVHYSHEGTYRILDGRPVPVR